MMPVHNRYLVSSIDLPFATNMIKQVLNRADFYVYSFTEEIKNIQSLIYRKVKISCINYLDSFLILEPSDEPGKIKFWTEFFDYFSDIYDEIIDIDRNIDNISNLYYILCEMLQLNTISKVLDFACGTGLSKSVISDIDLRGTDSSINMLNLAKKKGLRIVELSSLASQLNFYDAIFASYSLHLCHDKKTLSLLWSILKNDSILAANFHKGKGTKEVIDFVLNKDGIIEKYKNNWDERHGDYYVFIKK